MSSSRLLRLRAFVPALLLGAPLAANLVLRPPPAMVQSGTALAVEVEVAGPLSSGVITLVAWQGDVEVYRSERPLAGGPLETFAMPIPPMAVAQELVVQAMAGTVSSSPAAFLLIPAGPDPVPREDKEEAPAATKRSRGLEPASSSSAPLDRLTALPSGLARQVASFTGPDPLRYLNRKLNQEAQFATASLTIEGDLNNAELTRLLNNHRMIRAIVFGETPNLSPKGIIRALGPCQRLATLHIKGRKLGFAQVKDILDSHPTIVNLDLGDRDDFMDEEVRTLPERLENLSLLSVQLGDETLLRFRNLKRLHLTNCPAFTGQRLPAGLQELHVLKCHDFTGRDLPVTLWGLHVVGANAFVCPTGLPALRELTVIKCPAASAEGLREAVRAAPGLQAFSTDKEVGLLLEALPAGVQDLQLLYAGKVLPGGFAKFTQLRSLTIQAAHGFTGAQLPESLVSLTVASCLPFGSHPLPAQLESLTVLGCPGFSGQGLPGSLHSLKVKLSPGFPLPALMTLVDQLKGLRHVALYGVRPEALDADRLQAHPALLEINHVSNGGTTPLFLRPSVPAT